MRIKWIRIQCGLNPGRGQAFTLYGNLVPSSFFVPIAFETSGVTSPKSRLFLKELGHVLKLSTGEVRSAAFLYTTTPLGCSPER